MAYTIRREGTPFQEDLEPLYGVEDKIHTLSNNPEFIVRVEDYGFDTKKRQQENGSWKELRERYGIRIPAYQTLIGKDDTDNTTVYKIVQKVEGRHLDEIGRLNEQEARKFDDFFSNLLLYIREKFVAKEDFFSDIFSGSQYMLGKTKGDSSSHVYVVDIDNFRSSRSAQSTEYNDETINAVSSVISGILDAEERLPDAHSFFSRSREQALQCVLLLENSVRDNSRQLQWCASLKEKLNLSIN